MNSEFAPGVFADPSIKHEQDPAGLPPLGCLVAAEVIKCKDGKTAGELNRRGYCLGYPPTDDQNAAAT
jgi:hypothetical protein